MIETVLFYIFSTGALVGAFLMLFRKSPVSAAMSLLLSAFCCAAVMVLLKAGFLAVALLFVFGSIVAVLFIFALMLLNVQREEWGQRRHTLTKALSIALVSLLGIGLAVYSFGSQIKGPELSQDFGSVERLGSLLFSRGLLPFELTAFLILSAVIGVVVVAGRKV